MMGARSILMAATVAAAAGGGYGLGVATAPGPAVAQGADVVDLDVYARLDALETRVTGVEDELARPRNIVTAPFRIVDENGAPLMSVEMAEGNLPELKLGDGIILGYAEGQPRMSVFSDDGRVGGVHMLDGAVTVYASHNGTDGFFAASSAARGNTVRIFEGGQPVVSLARGDGDQPELKIGDGIILGYAQNEPLVSITSDDGRIAGFTLIEGSATVYASSDGTDGFFAGASATHGNTARIYQNGERVAELGVPPGRGAGARFFTGDQLIAGVGIGTSGEGLLFTGFADGTPAVTAGADRGNAYVNVFHGGSVAASVNTTDLGGTGLVVVRNSSGQAVSYLSEGAGGGGSVSATDPAGNEAFGAGWDGTQGAACVRRQNGNQFCLEPVMPLTRVQ
jgi:hypothetical protein